jgi:hypothetical protein
LLAVRETVLAEVVDKTNLPMQTRLCSVVVVAAIGLATVAVPAYGNDDVEAIGASPGDGSAGGTDGTLGEGVAADAGDSQAGDAGADGTPRSSDAVTDPGTGTDGATDPDADTTPGPDGDTETPGPDSDATTGPDADTTAPACTDGSCDDGNPCTLDTCDPAKGCQHAPAVGPCSDGSACTQGDTCADGKCQPGSAKACGANNPCTEDGCDPASGACVSLPKTATCADSDDCTSDDVCVAGACVGKPSCGCGSDAACDDKNPCTLDTCKDGVCTNGLGQVTINNPSDMRPLLLRVKMK